MNFKIQINLNADAVRQAAMAATTPSPAAQQKEPSVVQAAAPVPQPAHHAPAVVQPVVVKEEPSPPPPVQQPVQQPQPPPQQQPPQPQQPPQQQPPPPTSNNSTVQLNEVAESIRKATKGFGTDETALIQTLCGMPQSLLPELDAFYKSQYGKSVEDVLKSETSGNFGKLLCMLVVDESVVAARGIKKACDGMGTDTKALREVF